MLPALLASLFYFQSHLQVQSAFCKRVTTSRLAACHAGPCTPHLCGRPWRSTLWDRAPTRATPWESMPSHSPAQPVGSSPCHMYHAVAVEWLIGKMSGGSGPPPEGPSEMNCHESGKLLEKHGEASAPSPWMSRRLPVCGTVACSL